MVSVDDMVSPYFFGGWGRACAGDETERLIECGQARGQGLAIELRAHKVFIL
jgi:hypothetical protein